MKMREWGENTEITKIPFLRARHEGHVQTRETGFLLH